VSAASETRAANVDWLTLGAIVAVVGLCSNQLHEAGGHGGACLALGQHLATWGAFYVDCDTHAAPRWIGQVVAAAGSTVNFIAALLAYVLLRATPAQKTLTRFVWWFAFALNGLVWAGYYAFSGVSGIGDWGTDGVFDGVANWTYWRIGLAIGGLLLYWLWVRWSVRELGDMTGRDEAGRALARRVSNTAYWIHGVIAVVIGLLNPIGIFVLLASAAASSFGGASGLLWGPRYLRAGPPAAQPFVIRRNWAWIIFALALVVGVALVLGPSVNF
jgi:hypothetical protein